MKKEVEKLIESLWNYFTQIGSIDNQAVTKLSKQQHDEKPKKYVTHCKSNNYIPLRIAWKKQHAQLEAIYK